MAQLNYFSHYSLDGREFHEPISTYLSTPHSDTLLSHRISSLRFLAEWKNLLLQFRKRYFASEEPIPCPKPRREGSSLSRYARRWQ
jgi:hypothetical protein